MCKNLYRPIKAEVLDVITETPSIKTIRFRPQEPMSFKTGQFFEITVPGVGEAPFTPSSRSSIQDVFEVSVMRVGKLTKAVHELKPSDIIGVRGPMGNGYPLDSFRGKELLVMGGGCGFAPLRSLMYSLFDMSGQFKQLYFRGGCKNPSEFLYRREIESWGERKDLDLQLTVQAIPRRNVALGGHRDLIFGF